MVEEDAVFHAVPAAAVARHYLLIEVLWFERDGMVFGVMEQKILVWNGRQLMYMQCVKEGIIFGWVCRRVKSLGE